MALADDLLRFSVEVQSPIWRLSSRRYQPMSLPPIAKQGGGRFDDSLVEGDETLDQKGFAVLYCSESAMPTFVEVLGKFRPELEDLKVLLGPLMLEVGERDAFMEDLWRIPVDWVEDTQLTSARVVTHGPIFDLTIPAAVQAIREKLVLTILTLGHSDLDFASVLGSDRQLTRAISRWIWSFQNHHGKPLFSGIRYRSRFDPECICLAFYQDRYEIDGDIDLQPITSKTPGFAEAASILRLEIS